MKFPKTRYMGSKQAILPFIKEHIRELECNTVLDAFSGSGCVAYELKKMGKRVIANDHMKLAYNIAKATIENNSIRITSGDLHRMLQPNRRAKYFVRKKFKDLYFDHEDCAFIDNTYANIEEIGSSTKRSLALAALCRACMKKRPRGIFTFVGRKSWDGRRDLTLSLKEHFIDAISVFNNAIFSNGKNNKAICLDVFEVPVQGVDLVYIDTPYISPHSDCDYTRRYHFVEGLCSYWKGVTVQEETITKKIKSYPTDFKYAKTAAIAFERLFGHFKSCKIVVSYSSNAIPNREQMKRLLKRFKKNVRVEEVSHKYYFGNHSHKVGNNNNDVKEYLFIGT